jgi:hypothetical protein
MLHVSLGLGVGGVGVGAESSAIRSICWTATLLFLVDFALAERRFFEDSTGVAGVLHLSQSYTHMPAVVPGGPNGTH